ncbi:MAG: alkaline phosphatase family protein [Ferruginibacter sp.]
MKFLLSTVLVLALVQMPGASVTNKYKLPSKDTTANIFIITLDGYRWQELFTGADSSILTDEEYTSDIGTAKMLYWSPTAEERRKKLMPFTWNVLAQQGRLYGNRNLGSKVNVSNLHAFSYPGYSEMFTGDDDFWVNSNGKKQNGHKNIFEFLNSQTAYNGRIAIFTSWDVFPYILNEERSGITINSGYEQTETKTRTEALLNTIQEKLLHKKGGTRHDMLTYIAAKEYLQVHRPKIFYLGLGETDEFAHSGDYFQYLQKANESDRIIAELWHWVQTTDGYRDNTTFIITTDHGRGQTKWTSHNTFVKGSSQTWLALLGRGISPAGEMHNGERLYQKQVAQTIAWILGERFGNEDPLIDFSCLVKK